MVSLSLVLDFLAGEGTRATYAAVATATGAPHARALRTEWEFSRVDQRTAWVVLAAEGYQPPATKHTPRPADSEIIRDGDNSARRAAEWGRSRTHVAASIGTASTTAASDYGASSPELETLRRLVAIRCPTVRFGGFTPSGAANGEYSFRLPTGRSAWIRSPMAPKGGQRHEHPGRWLCRLTNRPRDPWKYARSVDDVVDWLTVQAQGW